MKKAMLVVAAAGLVVWVISWFRADNAVATSAGTPWPAGMGTLDSVAARIPPQTANAASVRLIALAGALPRNDVVGTFVAREIARADMAIGQPPPLPDVSAIRALLLREAIVWHRQGGVGNIGDDESNPRRAAQMTVARALVASALMKARAHDPSAWDDLLAVWNLARSIEAQPQPMQQTAALTMVRMINAVAWKMPLPAPAWLGELQTRDDFRPLLAAFQFQAASYWDSEARIFPTKFLSNSVDHDRRIAEALAHETRCDVRAPMNDLGTDLSSVWPRVFRYRAEKEATANALRIRVGKPNETRSRCSGGAWTFDGTTLRFSRDIVPVATDRAMPLTLRVSE